MGFSPVTYAAAKKVAEETAKGAGALVGPTGAQGPAGKNGTNGKSAYELAVDNGYSGTEAEWLASLKGADGKDGAAGKAGKDGETGPAGKSAYEIAKEQGYTGTEAEWIGSLKGKQGDKGETGKDGADGKSFTIQAQYATEAELKAANPTGNAGDAYYVGENTASSRPDVYIWLAKSNEWYNQGPISGVKGDDGAPGKSAYELAEENGYSGSESEWLASLKGAKGDKGEKGDQGPQGEQGIQGLQGPQGIAGAKGDKGDTGDMGRQLPLVNLGTEYTAELKADISSGKFEKAVVGGYLTINGHVYYLAHPDYWFHTGPTGDTECTTHHMLVIPAGNIGTGKMNNTNITTGAYAGSDMKTGNNANTALATARAQIIADFGASNILTHREIFANAVTDGKASRWAWSDSDIDLMNEVMVYGCNAWASHPGYETGIDKCQLKLFQERPDLITIGATWWLRSVVSASDFAGVDYSGAAYYYGASNVLVVRPAFAIC